MDRRIKTILGFFEKNYTIKDISVGRGAFRVLISCIISQRTRDANTERASRQLFAIANTPKQLAAMPVAKIAKLIKPCGFYRQKARRIKQTAGIIREKYNDKVPKTREELMKLPGVGWKTADITLMYGHGIPSVAVDTHVNRIPKRIGLVPAHANLEEVKKILEEMFPKKKLYIVNHGFVRFGQNICLPVNPKCLICPFNGFCKYKYSSKETEQCQDLRFAPIIAIQQSIQYYICCLLYKVKFHFTCTAEALLLHVCETTIIIPESLVVLCETTIIIPESLVVSLYLIVLL
ncbi:MAG: endonuclease III [Candidatus Aenigmarchaeota archaeon]|nr:endonuclease III [Candidatus Aenigmarchaeota archaeon]